jgi:hypothetical protein
LIPLLPLLLFLLLRIFLLPPLILLLLLILKLQYDGTLSNCAFSSNLRPYKSEQALQRYYELDTTLRSDGRLHILMDPNA